MALPPPLELDPPLLNTPTPAATDLADLTALYDCASTGAVTTRTSLIGGFAHDASVHQFVLFDANQHDPTAEGPKTSSLNTLGYSPLVLETYLGFIQTIAGRPEVAGRKSKKGFVVSVTGGPQEVAACYKRIAAAQTALPATVPLAMEVNLSCPNIPDKPPPAYSGQALQEYLAAIQEAVTATTTTRIPVGLKTPPYTYAGQFAELREALLAAAKAAGGVCPISFLTATNTLGSSLVLTTTTAGSGAEAGPVLPGLGIGGLAGAALHPIALGNVATLRRMLAADKAALGHIRIVGVGGVSDAAGYARMKSAGADVVGVGTGVLVHGVEVFGRILRQ